MDMERMEKSPSLVSIYQRYLVIQGPLDVDCVFLHFEADVEQDDGAILFSFFKTLLYLLMYIHACIN